MGKSITKRRRVRRIGTDRKWFVYILTINNQVVYVGKTFMPKTRLHDHKVSERMKERLGKKVNKLRLSIIEEYDNQCDALNGEIFWIQMMKFYGFTLVNYQHSGRRTDIPKNRIEHNKLLIR